VRGHAGWRGYYWSLSVNGRSERTGAQDPSAM